MTESREFISSHRRKFLGHCEAMPTNRRFLAPWSVEDTSAAFVVKDGGGQSRPAIGGEDAHERPAAADCGQYRKAARGIA
jgi:hypothetical protein